MEVPVFNKPESVTTVTTVPVTAAQKETSPLWTGIF